MTTGSHRSVQQEPLGALACWLALGVAILTLHAAAGALPAPPLGAPSQWQRWIVGRDPVKVAFGAVRLLGLGAAWYGLVITAVGVVLRLTSARRLATLVDRLTVVPLRRVAAATVAVGMSATSFGATAAGAAVPTSAPTATSTVKAPPSTTAPGAGPAGGGPPATVTMHLLEPSAAAPQPQPQPQPPPPPAPARVVPVPEPAVPATWTVQAGQCFWSIAEAQLGRAWGRQPSAAEIVPYWLRLMEANRSVLADPHNTDLVFPGQVFTLPDL